MSYPDCKCESCFQEWVALHVGALEHGQAAIAGELVRMGTKLDAILTKEDTIMAQYTDVKAVLDAVNTKTNELGDDVAGAALRVAAIQQQLSDLIAQGATPAQMQEALSQLTAVHDGLTQADTALKGIAADPANPVP